MEQVHATCVALGGAGVLLRGPAGCGKSDLALRLIDTGAVLVADDRVDLAAEDGRLMARAPAALAGRIEVRGLGVLAMDAAEAAPVALLVDLIEADAVERVPEAAAAAILGVDVPLIRLAPFEASAPAKVRAALRTSAIMVGR